MRILFDTGGQRSYVRKEIIESFGLSGPTEVLSISALGAETSKCRKIQRVKCSIRSFDSVSKDNCVEIEALAI